MDGWMDGSRDPRDHAARPRTAGPESTAKRRHRPGRVQPELFAERGEFRLFILEIGLAPLDSASSSSVVLSPTHVSCFSNVGSASSSSVVFSPTHVSCLSNVGAASASASASAVGVGHRRAASPRPRPPSPRPPPAARPHRTNTSHHRPRFRTRARARSPCTAHPRASSSSIASSREDIVPRVSRRTRRARGLRARHRRRRGDAKREYLDRVIRACGRARARACENARDGWDGVGVDPGSIPRGRVGRGANE